MRNPMTPSEWDGIADTMEKRSGQGRFIAGPDSAFYRLKQDAAQAALLPEIRSGAVLEVGCGGGANLAILATHIPDAELSGCDSSPEMIRCARKNLKGTGIPLRVVRQTQLPYPDRAFGTVFTVTVLQGIIDAQILSAITGEMARVAEDRVLLLEDVAVGEAVVHEDYTQRKQGEYVELMERHGFALEGSTMVTRALESCDRGSLSLLIFRREE